MKRFTIILFFIFAALSLAAETARDMIILVQPFTNSGEKKYDWLSAGMADSVINDLMLVKNVRVISEKDRKKSLKEIELSLSGMVSEQAAVKAGNLTGANVIFIGSYTVIGGNIRVVAKLLDVNTGELVKSAKLDGTMEGIFRLQDRIVITLLEEAQKAEIKDIRPLIITEQDRKAISEAPRTSLSAYELYSKGLQERYTNPRLALEYFEKAIAADAGYVDALQWAGYTASTTLSDFDRALNYINRAESAVRKQSGTNTEKYADLLVDKGTLYWDRQELDLSLESYLKARDAYVRLGKEDSMGNANALWGIGLIYYGRRQLNEAVKWYNESKLIYESLSMQDTSSFADLMTNFGSAYYSMLRKDEALVYYNRAKSILDGLQLHNTLAYANALWGIGLIYYEKSDYDTALSNYRNAEQTFINLGMQESSTFATFIMNIGIVYDKQNKLQEALDCYMRSKSIFDRLKLVNTMSYGILLINIGQIMQKQNNDQALQYLTGARELFERLNVRDCDEYANALYSIAYLYDCKGQKKEAAKYYRSAAEVYGRTGNTEWQQNALKGAKLCEE